MREGGGMVVSGDPEVGAAEGVRRQWLGAAPWRKRAAARCWLATHVDITEHSVPWIPLAHQKRARCIHCKPH